MGGCVTHPGDSGQEDDGGEDGVGGQTVRVLSLLLDPGEAAAGLHVARPGQARLGEAGQTQGGHGQ